MRKKGHAVVSLTQYIHIEKQRTTLNNFIAMALFSAKIWFSFEHYYTPKKIYRPVEILKNIVRFN